MDSYLSTQRSTIFQHVGVLIYVFDVENSDMRKDLEYYRDCIDGLRSYSPSAAVFLLVHKMDLVRGDRKEREGVLAKKGDELKKESGDANVTVFGTSIYDESLYKVRCILYTQSGLPAYRHHVSAIRHGPALSTRLYQMQQCFRAIWPSLDKHVMRLKWCCSSGLRSLSSLHLAPRRPQRRTT